MARHENQRKHLRYTMHRAAELVVRPANQTIRCQISDMSEGGARLVLSLPAVALPRHFTLMLFKDGSLQRDCEMVWIDRRHVGVKFVSGWYGENQ